MAFVSLTRLRIRSFRFLPGFGLYVLRALSQVKKAEGFEGGALLADKSWTFWTMTAWDSQESMRRYMTDGSHKSAMPHLMHWCDEASVSHWDQPDERLPTWIEADQRMRSTGRPSKVLNPSPQHSTLGYRAPQRTASGPIKRG